MRKCGGFCPNPLKSFLYFPLHATFSSLGSSLLCFIILSFFPPSPPLKHNAVNYLFTSPLNKNVLIVYAFLSRLVTLFPEHSLGLCLSHVPLHLMFFGGGFFCPLCLSYLCIYTSSLTVRIFQLLLPSISF